MQATLQKMESANLAAMSAMKLRQAEAAVREDLIRAESRLNANSAVAANASAAQAEAQEQLQHFRAQGRTVEAAAMELQLNAACEKVRCFSVRWLSLVH